MSAFQYEYDLAKNDQVIFLWNTQPIHVIEGNGFVAGLECIRTKPADATAPAVGKRNRREPVPIPGSEFTIDVDMVIRAVGQQPVTEFLRNVPGLQLSSSGTVVVNEHGQTGNPKYFAAGDCVNGGKEVVDAVAEGMQAAGSIDAHLGKPRARRLEPLINTDEH